MTKDVLEARRDELKAAYQQTDAAIRQAQANKHGIEGAIIECERWLKKLEEESCKSSETEPPPPTP